MASFLVSTWFVKTMVSREIESLLFCAWMVPDNALVAGNLQNSCRNPAENFMVLEIDSGKISLKHVIKVFFCQEFTPFLTCLHTSVWQSHMKVLQTWLIQYICHIGEHHIVSRHLWKQYVKIFPTVQYVAELARAGPVYKMLLKAKKDVSLAGTWNCLLNGTV